MGLFKLRTALLGLGSALIATSSLFADVLDDHQDGTNQNEFEYYWYYYDDNAGLKADDRPIAGVGTSPSVVNVPFTEGPRHAYGDVTDVHVVKTYTFTIGTDETTNNKYATMPFEFGDKWVASWCSGGLACAWPFVGVGTMLNADGKWLDLTGATSIKFKMRSKTSDLMVRFKVQTYQIDDDSSFGYYQKTFTATTEWQEFEASLNPLALAQPSWALTQAPHDFDITKCTKLAWEVSQEDNTTVITDQLDVDDIEVVGYTFVSRFMWMQEASSIPTNGLFASFDGAIPNKSPLTEYPTYWYAYNDGQIGGSSSVESGAVLDPTTNLLQIQFADGTGSDGIGKGAGLAFKLGEPIPRDTISIQGFVGIGCNLYDSSTNAYWDAQTAGATGIYFEYMCDGDIKNAVVEISDVNDVADAARPDNLDGRGSGIVMFRNLPKTGSAWRKVYIPFDSLLYHDDWAGALDIPLDLTKLAKVQFKVQGGYDMDGVLAIDNVAFPGVTAWGPVSVNKRTTRLVKTSAFSASYKNGTVRVNLNNKFSSGKISLVNTQGAVVASANVAKTASFSASKLSAGMYFVRLNAVDANGKAVVMQSPVNIVK